MLPRNPTSFLLVLVSTHFTLRLDTDSNVMEPSEDRAQSITKLTHNTGGEYVFEVSVDGKTER